MSLLAVGCTPEVLVPDQNKLPEVSELEVVITPDQTTNFVTFSIKNATGIVPMWIFGSEKIDGMDNKKYAYVGNDIVLRIRDAGLHKVEVKAYNAHGVSTGSRIENYTLDNTYRDPFDPNPYMKAVAGEWMWNSDVAGHFGCGENIANPTGWWAAAPNDKADWSLYNDRMTFTAEGAYSFDPGEDGKVYVNKDFTGLGGEPQAEDYLVDIPAYTSTYSFANNWNDAGIEEIWLVLPAQKNLSYIPNQTMYDDPRFLVLDSKPSAMRKELKLAAQNAPNGDATISWYYNFIPAVHVATPDELLAGTSAEGKVWVMDSAAKGHLGCGESLENPAGWWSANADEKAGTGLYDDEITFYPDGKYVYSSGADGLMYINWGVTLIGPNPGAEPDVDIEWPLTESTYEFDGETITLATETPMIYVPSDYVWQTPVFHVAELTETTMRLVVDNPGCYWQMILKARDVVVSNAPSINGNEFPAEISMAQGDVVELANIDLADFWLDPDFFAVNGTAITFNAVDGDYKFVYDQAAKWIKVIPMYNGVKATYEAGKALWIIGDGGGKPTVDHLIGWNTGDAPLPCAQISDNTYQITLAMKAEGGSVKVFGQADWGTEWTKNKYGTVTDNGFFHIPGDDGNIHTIAGTQPGYYTFTFVDNDGILDMTVTSAEVTKPEVPFTPGEQLDLLEAADILVGTWTWESSTDGHFGCGESIVNPTGWWNGTANCKEGCSLYDDTMTFAADGTYTFDPVDGMTFMNAGVTKYTGETVDHPTVPGASAPEGDFRVKAEVQTATWDLDESGDFPAIVIPAGTLFSYIPNDAFLDAPELYVTALWENQVEISAYTATGNGGGPIAWRYRLKRVQ